MNTVLKSLSLGVLCLMLAPQAYAATDAAAAKPVPAMPKPADGPSLKLSLELAQAALDACQAKGFPASASVVDSAGVVKVTLRADGAPKVPVAAPLKAATAAAFDAPGSELQPREKTDADFAAKIKAHPELYNDHPGSVPLHQNGKLIGGLAIADVDHALADTCVREALTHFTGVIN